MRRVSCSLVMGDKLRSKNVVENLDVDIMEKNDLTFRLAKGQVTLSDSTVYLYGLDNTVSSHFPTRCACVLRAPAERMRSGQVNMSKCLFPLTCHRSTDHSHWNHVSMLPTYIMRSHHGFGHHLV